MCISGIVKHEQKRLLNGHAITLLSAGLALGVGAPAVRPLYGFSIPLPRRTVKRGGGVVKDVKNVKDVVLFQHYAKMHAPSEKTMQFFRVQRIH
jgi:hypothetical protein